MAEAYGQRPSAWLGLAPDSWEAYQLDRATLEVGAEVESKLQERDKQNRPVHRLEDLLGEPRRQPRQAPGQFGTLKRRARPAQVREDGTW